MSRRTFGAHFVTFGESYESIALLEEPVRNRVELIKLAVFIGDIAVGRWMPWDQIEPPPGHMLKRHQISHLAQLIEKTRADLGRAAPLAQVARTGQIGPGRSAPSAERTPPECGLATCQATTVTG